MRYDPKVSTLEEQDDIKKVTMDELYGIITAYEMRTGQNGSSRKEAAFKVSLKNQSENPNDEKTIFINKLERGNGKYKGRLLLKCFNCGRIGHFSTKCTYTKQDENEEKETSKFKRGKPGNKKKPYGNKKIVYTMEDSEDSYESEVEETKVLFMGLDTQAWNSDSDVEGEVDLRVELVSALEELEKCRKKNWQSNIITSQLEAHLLDAKKVEEDLNLHLKRIIQESKNLAE